MSWQPSSDATVAQLRGALLHRARTWFDDRSILEVDVPALHTGTAPDPNIHSIRGAMHDNTDLYLQTSPESVMKRLLASDYPDIYAICKAFRQGEAGRSHQPEFTIVEWYRRGFGLDEIISDTVDFISALLDRPDLADPDVYEYGQAFRDSLGLDPLTAFADELVDAVGADDALRNSVGNDRDAWLDLLLSTRVAPGFATDRLTVVRHYPASQAALSRLCPGDRNVADRFEVFYGASELANGYVELTDSAEQRKRMTADLDRRRVARQPQVSVDEHLLEALEQGLPECAGVALGFERLLMIAARKDDIRDVVTFAYEENPIARLAAAQAKLSGVV